MDATEDDHLLGSELAGLLALLAERNALLRVQDDAELRSTDPVAFFRSFRIAFPAFRPQEQHDALEGLERLLEACERDSRLSRLSHELTGAERYCASIDLC
jgi:hypothetical protein